MVLKTKKQSLQKRIDVRQNPITGEPDTTDLLVLFERPLTERLKDLRSLPVYGFESNQEKFASVLGINKKTLSRIENL